MPVEERSSGLAWKSAVVDLSRTAAATHLHHMLSNIVRKNLALQGLTTSNLERKFFHGKLQNPLHIRDMK